MTQLPVDFFADSLGAVRGRQPLRFGCVRSRSEGVRTHMPDRGGLACGSSNGDRSGCTHRASATPSDEASADLTGNVNLTTGERAGAGDGLAGSAVVRSFGLEQPQHSLRAVGCPDRDDPTLGLTQRLRRNHPPSVPEPWSLRCAMRWRPRDWDSDGSADC